jgi:hypothetical protein
MIRRQLSLFVPASSALALERVRYVVDPIQRAMIPAHVTLCREEEIAGLAAEQIKHRLSGCGALTLSFAGPEFFCGHGIWLPCIGGQTDFDLLRRRVIAVAQVPDAAAHITLAHPRNPKAEGNSLDAIILALPLTVKFKTVALVEQTEVGVPWRVLREFELTRTSKQSPEPTAASGRSSS